MGIRINIWLIWRSWLRRTESSKAFSCTRASPTRTTREWPNKVKGIYENLLKDLNLKAEDVPLIAGELVPADQKGACASMNKIIEELPQTIPTAHVVSSTNCAGPPGSFAFHAGRLSGTGKALCRSHSSVAGCENRWSQIENEKLRFGSVQCRRTVVHPSGFCHQSPHHGSIHRRSDRAGV